MHLAVRKNQNRQPLLRRAANLGLSLFIIVIVFLVPVLLLRGMVWASEKALPWVIEAGQIAFALCGFVFLPLCTFRRTRPWAGFGFVVASYVFGTELFAYSCIVAFTIWGYAGLIVGLFLGGIGVVPVALLAAMNAAVQQRTQWGLSGDILLMLFLTFGTRFLGAYLIGQEAPEPKSRGAESVKLAIPVGSDRARIMVVSTEETFNKTHTEWLCRNGYDAVGCDLIRSGKWKVQEALEGARAFQPQVVLLFHNLRFTKEMTGLDLALLLFECLPNTRFIVGQLGDSYCVSEETLQEAQNRGYKFETFVIAPEGENLLELLEGQRVERD